MSLKIAVIGSGLGGLAAAVSLRRQGHQIDIYERFDFSGEVGANISCASNGTRFLEKWGINIERAKPVILESLVWHNWSDGKITASYPFGDYKSRFGTHYYSFHRRDIHMELRRAATDQEGDGPPATLHLNHRACEVDAEEGYIKFANGVETTVDLIIAADGINSLCRKAIGIEARIAPSTSCCYRCIVTKENLKELGISEFLDRNSIEYWTPPEGTGFHRVVMSPASGGDIVSCYCFYSADVNDSRADGWNFSATSEQLIAAMHGIEPRMRAMFERAEDIKMWKLYDHEPYPYWVKGKLALLGDSAHPMMPFQSQGAVSAFEDAAALGIIFSEQNTQNISVTEGLEAYESLRKSRATKLQAASLKARLDLKERIGWSSVDTAPGKLTIEEVAGYKMEDHIAGSLPSIAV